MTGATAVALFTTLLLAGCGTALPSAKVSTRTIQGTVTSHGKPLTYGWVEWHPTGSTVGTVTGAAIDTKGHYTCPSVPVGTHQIRVFVPDEPVLSGWAGPASPLSMDVPRGAGEPVELNLTLDSR